MPSDRQPGTDIFEIVAQDDEPWVRLADGEDLENWDREAEIHYNQRLRQTEKYKFFVKAFDFLTDNRVWGDYYEFGCHRVRTFRMALTEARRHMCKDMRFYAFDSFKGLPPVSSGPAVEFWQQGALATPVEKFWQLVNQHNIYTDRVTVVEGYYVDTLTDQRREEFQQAGRKAALVTIDCDLYESAVPVFAFLEPLLQEGTLLYIDDLFAGYKGAPTKGVARAFLEFQQNSAFKFARHCDVGWWGRSYVTYYPDPKLPNGIL